MSRLRDFRFTEHAIARYAERVRPGIHRHDAIRELHDSRAAAIRTDAGDGYCVWTVRNPAMRWITRPHLGTLVVVTVIAGTEGDVRSGLEEAAEVSRGAATGAT